MIKYYNSLNETVKKAFKKSYDDSTRIFYVILNYKFNIYYISKSIKTDLDNTERIIYKYKGGKLI